MADRPFETDTVISCIAFYKLDSNLPVTINHPGLMGLVAFMTGETPLNLALDFPLLLTGASFSGLMLIKQHPVLDKLHYPHETFEPHHYTAWATSLHSTLGSVMIVTSCEDAELSHTERIAIGEASGRLWQRFNSER